MASSRLAEPDSKEMPSAFDYATNSNSEVNEVTSAGRKPHEKIWYKDGNIVLATKHVLFRVHQSILAQHSTVFRDIFEQPVVGPDQGGSNNTEQERTVKFWEGVPVMEMAEDSDDDMLNMLSAVYFHECVASLGPCRATV